MVDVLGKDTGYYLFKRSWSPNQTMSNLSPAGYANGQLVGSSPSEKERAGALLGVEIADKIKAEGQLLSKTA